MSSLAFESTQLSFTTNARRIKSKVAIDLNKNGFGANVMMTLFLTDTSILPANPWSNKMTKVVVGHPRIITENFDDISSYFGLIKCTVLPPRSLFHPVLPYRTKGKLTFPFVGLC